MAHGTERVPQIKVLIGYPSDAKAERNAIAEELEWWNEQVGSRRGISLLRLRWPENAIATSVPGGDAQASFDQTVADQADILFAVFKHQAGSPTEEGHPSGTYHEIDHALKAGRPVHVFFSSENAPVDQSSAEAMERSFEEIRRLREVRDLIESRAMTKEYRTTDDLKPLVREAIEADVAQLLGPSVAADFVFDQPHRQVRVGTLRAESTGFQPRQLIRDQVDDAWARGASAVVLQGGGGFGKTQLATRIMREATTSAPSHQATDIVVWADATTPDGVRRAYADAARHLGLETTAETEPSVLAERFLDYLANNPDVTSLVILDNADEDFVDLLNAGFIPPGDGQTRRVLITTRYRGNSIVGGQGRRIVPVEVFSPAEAAAFVQDRLAANGMEALADDRIEELCRELGWMPLGLSISTAVMMRRRITVSRFAAQLADNAHNRDLLGEADPEGYPRPLADVWTTTLQHLDTLAPDGSIRRAALAAALLDPAGHHARIWASPDLRSFVENTPTGTENDADDIDTPEELILLEEFGLISLNGVAWPNLIVRMHPLTALAVLDSQTRSGESLTLREAAVAVAKAYQATWESPRYVDQADESLSVRNLVHVLRQPNAQDLFNTEILRICLVAVQRLADRGAPAMAKEFIENLLAAMTPVLGENHRDVLFARYILAHCVGKVGNHEVACDLLQASVDRQTALFGVNDPDTLVSRINLAVEHSAMGNRSLAIQQLEEMVPQLQQIVGALDERTLDARGQLARITGNSGRKDEAIREFRELLQDQIAKYGTQNHESVLLTRFRLVEVLGESGHVQEAAAEAQAVAEASAALLGPNALVTFSRRGSAARWQANAGDVKGALVSYRQIIEDMSRAFGADHPDTMTQRHNYVFFLMRAGQLHEAITLGRQLLAERSRVHGPDSISALTTRIVVAHAIAANGQLGEALAEYRNIAEIRDNLFGPGDHKVLDAQENVVMTAARLGETAHVLDKLKRILSARRLVQDATDPDLIVTARRIAYWSSRLGDTAPAVADLQNLVEEATANLGPDHLQTLKTRHALARAHADDGQLDKAIAELTSLAADEARVISADRPEAMATRYQLARCLAMSGSVEDGVVALKTVFTDRLRTLGPDHPDTLNTRRELALWQARQGDIPGAVAALESLEKDQTAILCEGHPHLVATRALLADLRPA